MKLYFRVDSNRHIGSGHLMRCLCIADSALRKGIESVFITADAECANVLNLRGYRNIILESDWTLLEDEKEKMINLIKSEKISVILFDSYYVSNIYLGEIRKVANVICIDDLGKVRLDCDMVFCFVTYNEKLKLEGLYQSDTKMFVGTKYSPCRECFRKLPKKVIRDEIQRILILTGNSDNYHIALNLIKRFFDEPVDIIVVCGAFSPDLDELLRIKRPCLQILSCVDNIAALMLNADIAITAAGMMIYELCLCGTPAISYSLADNQLMDCAYFEENDLIPYAGDIREGVELFCDRVAGHYEVLKQYDVRYRKSNLLRCIFDGNGSERIVESIVDNVFSDNK